MLTCKQKRRVTNFVEACLKEFHLTQFEIYYKWTIDIENASAHIWIDPTYLRAEVSFNPDFILSSFKKKQFDDVRFCIVHELMHLVVNPLLHISKKRFVTEEHIDANHEKVTEHVARLLFPRTSKIKF